MKTTLYITYVKFKIRIRMYNFGDANQALQVFWKGRVVSTRGKGVAQAIK